jgi:polyisoprenoid-binding protein YceI
MLKKIIISTALAAALFAGDYTLDMTHSGVGFSIKHLMVSNVKGKFKVYDGNFSFDEKAGKITKLEGVVDVASIDTEIQKRDDHLRSADFFDATKFPKMDFVMTKFTAGKKPKVEAKLTIKGVTKTVVFDADIGGAAVDPWGTKKAGFSLTGVINRKDFGLNWSKSLETGGFVVGDEVKLSIDLEGNAK